jgi:hypothetical protein
MYASVDATMSREADGHKLGLETLNVDGGAIRMFAKTMAVFMFVLAASVPCLAQDDNAPTRGATLSASDVKAIHAAYDALSSQQQDGIGGTLVTLKRRNGATRVSFATPDGVSRFSVNSRTGALLKSSVATSGNATVTLGGADAKAISLVYGGWVSGKLPGPSADLLRSNGFTVDEFRVSASPNWKAGYIVSVKSADRSKAGELTGRYARCQTFVNYRVDPVTWRAYEEPQIC